MAVTGEPGLVVDRRYLLREQLAREGPATRWRATDTILAHEVTLWLLPATSAEAPAVLAAARRAARVQDGRLPQVLDMATAGDLTFVVTEWVDGPTLSELVTQAGPLRPRQAASLVREAAEALTAAHRQAVWHLRLEPEHVVSTPDGVKVLGVGLDAALAGAHSDDPTRTDAEGLGWLLQVALTGASQRSGMPAELDEITVRALEQRTQGGRPALATPAAVAEALARYGRRRPAPVAGIAGAPPRHGTRRTTRRRAAVALTTAVVAVAAGVVGLWAGLPTSEQGASATLSPTPPRSPSTPSSASSTVTPSSRSTPATSSSSATPVAKRQVPVVAARAFDPGGDGHEHDAEVSKAIDGIARTAWRSDGYTTAKLGNLKPGVGVVLDLGKSTQVESVELRLPTGGADLELRAATLRPEALDDTKKVATMSDAGRKVELRPDGEHAARYWVVWFTYLPRNGDGHRAGLADVAFRPAS
ncbi:MAG: hypothetical protein GEV07_11730 [Streptosporangiales bacterium]|nr:hypothetical protein [Streptosporangiales bacterium]